MISRINCLPAFLSFAVVFLVFGDSILVTSLPLPLPSPSPYPIPSPATPNTLQPYNPNDPSSNPAFEDYPYPPDPNNPNGLLPDGEDPSTISTNPTPADPNQYIPTPPPPSNTNYPPPPAPASNSLIPAAPGPIPPSFYANPPTSSPTSNNPVSAAWNWWRPQNRVVQAVGDSVALTAAYRFALDRMFKAKENAAAKGTLTPMQKLGGKLPEGVVSAGRKIGGITKGPKFIVF